MAFKAMVGFQAALGVEQDIVLHLGLGQARDAIESRAYQRYLPAQRLCF